MSYESSLKLYRLKYIANIEMGQSPSSDEYSFSIDEGLPFLQGTADFGKIHPIPRVYCKEPSKIAKPGDILLSVRAPVGDLNIANQEYGIGRGLCAIQCQKFLERDFAWWALHWAREQLSLKATGSTYDAVTVDDVANLFIPLFSIEEQRVIVDYLDYETAKIDTLISAKKDMLELLTEKRRALITQVVTRGLNSNVPMRDSGVEWLREIPIHWEIIPLKILTKRIGSGKTPKGGAEVYASEGIPFIRSQNVLFNGLSFDDIVFISEEINSEMSNSQVRPHDVLLNITGASIGRSCIVPEVLQIANVNQHVCIIRPDTQLIKSSFLNRVLVSDIGQFQVFSGEVGVSREGLSFEAVGKFLIPVPSLEEQQEIIEYLDKQTAQIDDFHNALQKTITLLQERRAALIAAAVTGKIRVPEEYEA